MIFISYSWMDSEVARDISMALNKAGYRTWIDYQMLDLTAPLKPQLGRAIQSAEVFLLVDSLNARTSDWVRFEISQAEYWHKPIHKIFALSNKRSSFQTVPPFIIQ